MAPPSRMQGTRRGGRRARRRRHRRRMSRLGVRKRRHTRGAERRGARIFEGSPVRRIQRHSHGVTVSTASGRVRADVVLVATGYATPEFKPLAGRFKMLQTYVVATERLTARRRAALGLGNVM